MLLKILRCICHPQFVIFKPLSYCFEEAIGFDVKTSFANRSVVRLISWYNKPSDITKEFRKKAIQFHRTFHGLKITNCPKRYQVSNVLKKILCDLIWKNCFFRIFSLLVLGHSKKTLRLGFLTNHKSGEGSRFFCKNGGIVHKEGLSIEVGNKLCFSLLIYGFCRSNALCSASLSVRMFIFLLTYFDTWDCYYFGLNLSQVLLIKVLFTKKACNVVF